MKLPNNTPVAQLPPLTKAEVRFDGEQIRILSESDILLGDGTSTETIDSGAVRCAITAINNPDFDVEMLNHEPCSTFFRKVEFSEHLLTAIVSAGIEMCLDKMLADKGFAEKVAYRARNEKVCQLRAQVAISKDIIKKLTIESEPCKEGGAK